MEIMRHSKTSQVFTMKQQQIRNDFSSISATITSSIFYKWFEYALYRGSKYNE